MKIARKSLPIKLFPREPPPPVLYTKLCLATCIFRFYTAIRVIEFQIVKYDANYNLCTVFIAIST